MKKTVLNIFSILAFINTMSMPVAQAQQAGNIDQGARRLELKNNELNTKNTFSKRHQALRDEANKVAYIKHGASVKRYIDAIETLVKNNNFFDAEVESIKSDYRSWDNEQKYVFLTELENREKTINNISSVAISTAVVGLGIFIATIMFFEESKIYSDAIYARNVQALFVGSAAQTVVSGLAWAFYTDKNDKKLKMINELRAQLTIERNVLLDSILEQKFLGN